MILKNSAPCDTFITFMASVTFIELAVFLTSFHNGKAQLIEGNG